MAVQKVYDFIWDTYCDWYIELTKARLYGEDADAQAAGAAGAAATCLTRSCELLHPFMPFITEEIWQAIPHEGERADRRRSGRSTGRTCAFQAEEKRTWSPSWTPSAPSATAVRK